MTIGISKEVVERIIKDCNLDYDHHKWIAERLREECRELDPWLPIDENTPKDKPAKIYDKGYGQVIVIWNEYHKCFTDQHGHKYLNPTHYKLLPEDPKEE